MLNIIKRIKPLFTFVVFTVLIFSFIFGCKTTKSASQAGNILPDFVQVKHLIFIGLDGWGGVYVSKANMPTVKRMMSQGAWSLTARSVKPCISWPNWTSLFYGAPPEQRNREDFPSIFTLVKNNGQAEKSIFFSEWTELHRICSDKTAEKQVIYSDIESARKVAAYITEKKPFFTSVVFNEPDITGHSKNWGSRAYYAKLAELDGFIAIIEQAVKDAGIYDSTVFILSADHGGTFRGHEVYFPKHYKIPVIFYGSGIKEGFAISSIVNIYDIVPTMAALLGMKIPPEWTGRILYEVLK